ncbi:hypothetical protein ACIBEH_13555 [Nocardia salmonicida]|uniref:hypothetical protein n=1 Tax=Nocardia salmonicida TaxID=53431 RepID=UPI0037BB0AC0
MNTAAATILASEWKDYGPFVQGAGAVLAALTGAALAGYFLTRNSQKTPYEHLALLVEARSGWPQEAGGLSTVDHSITRALAQIRLLESDALHDDVTPDEILLELRLVRLNRKRHWATVSMVVSTAGLALVVFSFLALPEPIVWAFYAGEALILIGLVAGLKAKSTLRPVRRVSDRFFRKQRDEAESEAARAAELDRQSEAPLPLFDY